MQAWLIGIIVLVVVQIIPRIIQRLLGPQLSTPAEGTEGEVNMAGGSVTEITSVNQFEGIMKGLQKGQLLVIGK